ncbi:hypothetical protein FB45DRAFT_1022873 [Roridomyces roridus]|uniref:Uncharacterized protein n=1 Tax=Roridomyces roridus TaxID=1738132 RepID=A0AAD7C983_9AGAR|nr:hypothetical protein FB45DRAFT_1022873 [Roridomyces roridus]
MPGTKKKKDNASSSTPPKDPKPAPVDDNDSNGSDSDDEEPVKGKAKGKKRGNACHFKGQHFEFMKEQWPVYMTASEARKGSGKGSGNQSALEDFWRAFFAQWWKKFPWRLELDEEPDPDVEPVEEKDEDMSEKDLDAKAEKQRNLKKKIKGWFNRQRPTSTSIHSNPFFPWLSRLRAIQESSSPRRASEPQYLMQHEKYKKAFEKRFKKEHPTPPKEQCLALQVALATKMLAELLQEDQAALREQRDKEHEIALKEYEEAVEGLPSMDPDVQQECRNTMAAVLGPLLGGLKAYMGYTFNVLAARVGEGGNFDVASVNLGDINGQSWVNWNTDDYREVLTRFLKFVLQVEVEAGKNISNASVTEAVNAFCPPAHAAATTTGTAVTHGSSSTTSKAPAKKPAAKKAATQSPAGNAAGVAAPPVHLLNADLIQITPEPSMDNGLVDLLPLADHDDDHRLIMTGVVSSSSAPAVPAPAVLTPAVPTPAVPVPAVVVSTPAVPIPAVAVSTLAVSTHAVSTPAVPTPAVPTPAVPIPAAIPETLETWGLWHMSLALRAELLALELPQQNVRVRMLQRMGRDDLQREINAANNRVRNRDMGLATKAAFVGMRPPKRAAEEEGNGTKRKRAKKGKGRKKKQTAHGDNEEEEDVWDSGKETESSESEDEKVVAPVATARPKPQPQTRSALRVKNNWAIEWKDALLEDADGKGENWRKMVELWCEYEAQASALKAGEKAPKPWPTTKQPRQAHYWVADHGFAKGSH